MPFSLFVFFDFRLSVSDSDELWTFEDKNREKHSISQETKIVYKKGFKPINTQCEYLFDADTLWSIGSYYPHRIKTYTKSPCQSVRSVALPVTPQFINQFFFCVSVCLRFKSAMYTVSANLPISSFLQSTYCTTSQSVMDWKLKCNHNMNFTSVLSTSIHVRLHRRGDWSAVKLPFFWCPLFSFFLCFTPGRRRIIFTIFFRAATRKQTFYYKNRKAIKNYIFTDYLSIRSNTLQ